jgi:hypothetical protein
MSHNSLQDYYQLMFALEQHHKYQTSEIENWIIFEKDIKVDMLHQFLEHKKQLEEAAAREA